MVGERHHRDHLAPPPFTGPPDDGDVADSRVEEQRRLHLFGEDGRRLG